MEISDYEFEIKWLDKVMIHHLEEGVSFNTALETLLYEYKKCNTEEEWNKLLEEWELV